MEMMLPGELSLPFFSAITEKVCFQRKYKSWYTEEDKPAFSPSLMHACFVGEKPNRSIHTGQISRNSSL